jgi:hypothetical protein
MYHTGLLNFMTSSPFLVIQIYILYYVWMHEGLEDSVVQSLNDVLLLLNVGNQESNKLKIRGVDNCTLRPRLTQLSAPDSQAESGEL